MKSWLKGGIIGLIILILSSLILFLLSPMSLINLVATLNWSFFLMPIIMGAAIGKLVTLIKEKKSYAFIGFWIGVIFTIGIIFFMIYDCYFLTRGILFFDCFFTMNLNRNFGYVWIIISLALPTFVGWLIGKMRRKR